jgi:type I restriction enzyme, S subunit
MDLMCSDQVRTYERAKSIVFLKTKEAFGGLSNMAGGFPLRVNGIRIFSSEALYQACRFPHLPDVQRVVLGEPSPMTAKMKSKPYRKDSRPDWDQVRVRIMRWCLRVKLVQHWKSFGELLLETGDKSIVEESHKDEFWGAKPADQSTLVGMNVLGRLLMELREELKSERRDNLLKVEPLQIPDFLLMGQAIQTVEAFAIDIKRTVAQTSLFDKPMHAAKDQTPPVYANNSIAISGLKPYTDYKDSGLPWLGWVPAHWGMRRTKVLLRERVDKGFPNEPLLAATQSKGVVRKEDYGTRTVTAQKDFHLLKLVEIGDFVISLRSFEGGIEVAHNRGIISPAYTVLEPRSKTTSGYLRHFFKSPTFISSLTLFVTGIREGQNIDYERLSRAFLPLPPDEEQAAIVRFLDHATHRLDKAIQAKRKTIALLNEQKQVIIHRAVTRGLDPNVRLKPSGVELLGDVPEHWEVRKLGALGIFYKGRGIARADITEKGVPAITYGDIYTRYGIEAKALSKCTSPQVAANAQEILSGDLLFTASGETIEDIGKTTLFSGDVPGYAGGDIIILRIKEGDGLYLSYVLNSSLGVQQKSVFGRGDIIVHISAAKLKQVVVPFPPPGEQIAIARFLDQAAANIAAVIDRATREIELLREYRTRLIADVVTGKLDVREAAAHLPEEALADQPMLAALEEADDELAEEEA